jgi:hypothetical protein
MVPDHSGQPVRCPVLHLSPCVGIPAFRPGGKRILSAGAAKRRSVLRIYHGSGQGLAVMKLLGVE